MLLITIMDSGLIIKLKNLSCCVMLHINKNKKKKNWKLIFSFTYAISAFYLPNLKILG